MEDPLSPSNSVAGGPTRSAVAEPFPHEWYIRVKASFRDTILSTVLSQLPSMEKEAISLHDSLKAQLKVEDFQLLPQRFMDESDARTEKAYTCYWLIGLPTMPPAEIAEARKIARAWEVEANEEKGADRVVQAKFVKQKAILEQNLEHDVPPKDLADPDAKKSKTETRRTGQSFKKIKGSNPAQVKKQFMQYAMGAEVSGAQSSKSSGGKLRPPKDVFNRLKYGGGYKLDEYVVGYIDRQAGILEKQVDEWQEYEEQELIAYFKHVPDDEIVWDRERKIDWIFNARPS